MGKEEIGTDITDFEPNLWNYIGQEKAITILKAIVDQFYNDKNSGRNVSIPSILLVGNEGLGKRTIAKAISDAFGNTEFKEMIGQILHMGDDIFVIKDTGEDATIYINSAECLSLPAQSLIFKMVNENILYIKKPFEDEAEEIPLDNRLIILSAQNTKRICYSIKKAIDITITLSDYSDNEISQILDQRIRALNWEIETKDILKMITHYSQNNPAEALKILQMAYRIMISSDKDILEMNHIRKALYLLDYKVENVKNEVKDNI